MRFGRLRHRVTVQERSTTRDSYGAPAHTWTATHASVPAEVTAISGRELLAADAVQGETTHRVRMRYRDGVTTDNRVLFGTRVFNIRQVIPDRLENALEILCTEGVSNG